MRRAKGNWTSISVGVATVVAAVFLVSCESADKAPAAAAITAAQSALDAVKGEAEKWVPDQVKSVESAIADARASFEKKDYKAALSKITSHVPLGVVSPIWRIVIGELPRSIPRTGSFCEK